MRAFTLGTLLVTGALAAGTVFTLPAGAATDWQQVGTDKTTGVSGIAVTATGQGGSDALIVRDNKKSGQNRVAKLHLADGQAPTVTPLGWSGDEPDDLEAMSSVPGDSGHAIVLSSDGTGYLIDATGSKVKVQDDFDLPDTKKDGEYEGFALATLSGRTVAVWAERGDDDTPATISAATFDPDKLDFGKVQDMDFTAPYPTSNVRNASDVAVEPNGTLLVSSASDNGDDGPFDSALYAAGTVAADGNDVTLTPAGPGDLGHFAGHKVEGVACLPGSSTGILGTDDENKGGFVRTADFCTP